MSEPAIVARRNRIPSVLRCGAGSRAILRSVTEEKLLKLAERHYKRGIHWLNQAEHAEQQGVCAGMASAYFGAGSLALAVRSARLSVAAERVSS